MRLHREHLRDPFRLVVAFVEPHSPYNGPINDVNPLDEVESTRRLRFRNAKTFRCKYSFVMREWQQAEAL